MAKPTIEIESLEISRTGDLYWTAWFWLDGKPVHLGHFETKVEAEWAGRAALRVAELQRDHIRNLL